MSRIPEDKIEEIRSATNIVHYISQFVNLKKAGRNYKGLCPFHTEKTPSFIVSPEKQIYHCFGCGQGGNVFSFIQDYEKLSFVEAITKAADFCGIALPKVEYGSPDKEDYYRQLYDLNESACTFFEKILHEEEYKSYLQYFLNRGLSIETIKKYRLGYAPDSFDRFISHLNRYTLNKEHAEILGLIQKKERGTGYYDKFRHRIIFPFINISGKIVGFGGRKLRDEQQPKYLNSPESPVYKKGELLYGLHQAIRTIRENDYVLLVEGYFDLLRLVEAGIRNTVASSGTALTDRQAKLLRRYTKNVYIAYDGDDAGIRAAVRVAYVLENQGLDASIVPIPAGEDPDSIVEKNGASTLRSLIDQRQSVIEFELQTFFQHTPSPTLQEKESFINEIFQRLLEQPNRIKSGLIIHQISDRMQVDEQWLIDHFNYQRKTRRMPRKAVEDSPPDKATDIQRGAYKAELGLLSVLLSGDGNLRGFILEHISADMFENPDLQRIFNLILNEIEEIGEVDINSLLEKQDESEAIKSIISELVMEDHSGIIKFTKDCVFQLKKWHLENKSRELSQYIRAESDSMDSIIHYTRELSKIRKEIAGLDQQIRRNGDTSL